MCGIAGIITNKLDSFDCDTIIQKTLEITSHRGPDHKGIFSEQIGDFNICFGVNRLAIIDLAPSGNQPMHLDNLTIVYNGEVYNYLEIKEQLIKKGHKFIGNSDTEVVLHAFQEWGTEGISKFIGMFAMAIFNRKERSYYLIRDRVGEKPLYYYYHDNIFIFASELKGILKHSFIEKKYDENGIFNYFVFESVAACDTLFRDIQQIAPGQIVKGTLSVDKIEINQSRYWEFPKLMPDYSLTEKKVLSDLTGFLYDAVKIRLRSDVGVGVFLSGGIDSSLIAAVASEISPRIKTFTIAYKDKKHDESRYAEFVAKRLKTDHRTILLKENEANLDFDNLSYISDSCIANPSIIPYYNLVQKTRKYVKVALSGDGGDEFFCGYTRFGLLIKLYKYRHIIQLLSLILPFHGKTRFLKEIFSDVDSLDTLMAQFRARIKLRRIRNLFSRKDNNFNIYQTINVKNMLLISGRKTSFWGFNYYEGGNCLADNILNLGDRVSMYHGLEVRSVFTDHRIIEYMATAPETIVLKKGIDKFLLKEMLKRYLPEKFVFNRVKKGFTVPLDSDYKDKWSNSVKKAIAAIGNIKQDFLNVGEFRNILESREGYLKDFQFRLVFLVYFMKRWEMNDENS